VITALSTQDFWTITAFRAAPQLLPGRSRGELEADLDRRRQQKKARLVVLWLALVMAFLSLSASADAWTLRFFEGFDHYPPGSHSLTAICPSTTAGCVGPYFHSVSGSLNDSHGQQRSRAAVWSSKGYLNVAARNARPGEGSGPLTGGLLVENGAGHTTYAWEARITFGHDPTSQVNMNMLTWPAPGAPCWPVGGENNNETLWGGGRPAGLFYYIHSRDPSFGAPPRSGTDPACGHSYSMWWPHEPIRWPATSGGAYIDTSQPHIYRFERRWESGVPSLTYKVDNRTTLHVRDARIPMTPQVVSFQTDTRWFGQPVNTTLRVDWVRLYT
jgi:hypothetical protein